MVVRFIDPEYAKRLARHETVVFAEVVGRDRDREVLEVHVMRPTGDGPFEIERDDTGCMTSERARLRVAQIAAAHGCRYATIYPAENRWPPPWATARLARKSTAPSR